MMVLMFALCPDDAGRFQRLGDACVARTRAALR